MIYVQHLSYVFLIILLDQLSKQFVITNRLPFLLNSGIAFSIPFSNIIALTTAIIVILGLYYFFFKKAIPSKLMLIALSLVIGGALGNVIDRILIGAVIDFISIGPFPSFNLADSAVTVGMILIIFQISTEEKKTMQNPK